MVSADLRDLASSDERSGGALLLEDNYDEQARAVLPRERHGRGAQLGGTHVEGGQEI